MILFSRQLYSSFCSFVYLALSPTPVTPLLMSLNLQRKLPCIEIALEWTSCAVFLRVFYREICGKLKERGGQETWHAIKLQTLWWRLQRLKTIRARSFPFRLQLCAELRRLIHVIYNWKTSGGKVCIPSCIIKAAIKQVLGYFKRKLKDFSRLFSCIFTRKTTLIIV